MAAKWGGYTITDFQRQDVSVQAFVIAARRIESVSEAIISEESMAKSKRGRKAPRK